LGKKVIDYVRVYGSDMERCSSDEEDFIRIDNPRNPFFPMLVQMEELPCVGHIFAQGFGESGKKAVDWGLIDVYAVKKRDEGDCAPIDFLEDQGSASF
jgi:hypothetical protein